MSGQYSDHIHGVEVTYNSTTQKVIGNQSSLFMGMCGGFASPTDRSKCDDSKSQHHLRTMTRVPSTVALSNSGPFSYRGNYHCATENNVFSCLYTQGNAQVTTVRGMRVVGDQMFLYTGNNNLNYIWQIDINHTKTTYAYLRFVFSASATTAFPPFVRFGAMSANNATLFISMGFNNKGSNFIGAYDLNCTSNNLLCVQKITLRSNQLRKPNTDKQTYVLQPQYASNASGYDSVSIQAMTYHNDMLYYNFVDMLTTGLSHSNLNFLRSEIVQVPACSQSINLLLFLQKQNLIHAMLRHKQSRLPGTQCGVRCVLT
jgi:hypothetical protein